MNNKAESVKKLLETLSDQEKIFFGRRPSIKEVQNYLKNFNIYHTVKSNVEGSKNIFGKNGYLQGRRINMAETYIVNECAVGYNAFTIMQNANATPLERKFMDMGSGLKNIYSKGLYVHSDYRNQGIESEFVRHNLDLSKSLDKHYLFDVNRSDYKLINVLSQFEFEEDFHWTSKKGHQMIRFYHD